MPETELLVPEFPIMQFQPLEILFPYPVSDCNVLNPPPPKGSNLA